MRVYLDTEFTGFHQGTTLVSIGCVATNGRTFYAELTDYDESQVNGWLNDNVIAHLRYGGHPPTQIVEGANEVWRGDQAVVKAALGAWLASFGELVEIWSD